MPRQGTIALRSVEIVSIDNSKRFVDSTGRRQGCVQRSPWLDPAGWDEKSRRKFVEFLKNVLDIDVSFKSRTYLHPEGPLNVFPNHENNLGKPAAERVVNRIIHDCFPTWANRIYLLQAPIATAHASCKYQQSWRYYLVHQIRLSRHYIERQHFEGS